MKTSGELERLDRIANDAENEFWIRAGETIVSLIKEKGTYADGIFCVDVGRLFGDEPATMRSTINENRNVSPSKEPCYDWDVEEIFVDKDVLYIECESIGFRLDEFERSDVVHLARLLEKMGEASE